jgi:hypothetical protein
MIQIIKTVDLTKMWGKEGEVKFPSVVDHNVGKPWEGQFFEVLLDKGEMLAQKYSCDVATLAKIETFHGQNNIVVISKSIKGKAKDSNGHHYYNDTITDIMTLSKYAKMNVQEEVYVSKFAKPAVKRVKATDDSFIPPVLDADALKDRG